MLTSCLLRPLLIESGILTFSTRNRTLAGRMIHHNPDGGLNQEERSGRIKITQATLIGLCGNKFDKEVWSFGQDITTSGSTSSNENNRRRVCEAELITIILQDQAGVGTYFKYAGPKSLAKCLTSILREGASK